MKIIITIVFKLRTLISLWKRSCSLLSSSLLDTTLPPLYREMRERGELTHLGNITPKGLVADARDI